MPDKLLIRALVVIAAAVAVLTSDQSDIHVGFIVAAAAAGLLFRLLVVSPNKAVNMAGCAVLGIASSVIMRWWFPADVERSAYVEFNSFVLFAASTWAGSLAADLLRAGRANSSRSAASPPPAAF